MPSSTTLSKVVWTGHSDRKYEYVVYPWPTAFKALPGNYIFCLRNTQGQWVPVYIGETVDLSERFDNHHKMPCVKVHGATHIHVQVNKNGQVARQSEEKDLVARYAPPCNG